ncbi:hypothetical protein IFM47457_07760 [Aspergillus lentulus]|nr:hypothetical protein IFM47457_07760 [Aspergillus lentulus]
MTAGWIVRGPNTGRSSILASSGDDLDSVVKKKKKRSKKPRLAAEERYPRIWTQKRTRTLC